MHLNSASNMKQEGATFWSKDYFEAPVFSFIYIATLSIPFRYNPSLYILSFTGAAISQDDVGGKQLDDESEEHVGSSFGDIKGVAKYITLRCCSDPL